MAMRALSGARLRRVRAQTVGDFWSRGMNLYFNRSDFLAAPGISKRLVTAAVLVALGITDAGSINGTYFDAAGVMQTKSGTAPRLNHVGGFVDSMLVEPAATNLCPYATAVGGTGWTIGGAGVTNSFRAAGSAPDGITAWTNTSFSGGTADDRLYNAGAATTNAATYTVSVYVYADAATTFRLGWYDSDLRYSADIAVGTGITRVSWSSAVTATTTYPYVANRVAGGVNAGLHFWGMQLELGPVATTFIRNVDATLLTRSEVDIQQPVSSLPGYNLLNGTWGARFTVLNPAPTAGVNPRVIGVDAGGAALIAVDVLNNTVFCAPATATTPYTPMLDARAAYATDRALHRICHNNNVGQASFTISPNPTYIRYGKSLNGVGVAIGNIKRVSFSPTIATNAQLQAISAGTL